MILTVTPNAALDVTYRVDTLRTGGTHRVHDVHTRAGGKGVNVADILTQLGEPVHATGFAGQELRARLPGFVPIAGPSRRTVTILSPDEATLFNEPGPAISTGEWAAQLAASHPEPPPTATPSSSAAHRPRSSSTPTANPSATASPPAPH
jgi:tagatose 6-phosphate kinase